ncbi:MULTISPECIES: ABC transporter substrate-binding protein [Streptomyces]|uniref:Peptide ABC transporter membrane protein n=1 Tax=Streptomyces albus (strain ATCC 21838 / DSM 41398 / FERM P-419 / JCM 4703 / NBRC 107858) TaxID=1081613 RepID=A0A0B5ERW1_STRA4|nr:ABC transporter substrate-binding protein [Streptomyces sp. SCSIO ZS0520]AJE81501.1 peptide ABC transporter membrane protein [Streptomyces albus]AOU75816.1 peptide ABC transporter membrane protein [Streptomyces albus]AYN31620.1 peptide ABC transporter permease [Streptomyces albus]
MPGPVTPRRRPLRPAARATALGAALAALLVPSLTACGGDSSSAAQNSTLKWATSSFPAHWDPVVGGSGAQFRALALTYASLTRVNEKGDAVPDLAESWKYNAKGDQVTFRVRSGLKFSDGEPVDAAAVKAAVERAKKQKNSALFGDLTSIRSVEAKGQDAVVHLTQVDYQIPQLLGERVLQIASPKAAEKPAALDQNPVGAGPFTVTQVIPGTKAVLKKNPDYWDAKNIHIDKVELTSAPDASTVVSGLRTGVYNFADIDPRQAGEAKKAGLDVFVQPGYNAANISLNVNKAPFDDDKVVDAVRYAVNRKEFVDKLTFGYGKSTDQPFPPGYIAYDPGSAEKYPYDPAASRKLLAEAGYEPGELKLKLVIPAEDPAAEIVQSQLAEVGIKVTIKIDKNWATPFFAKDLAFSLYSTTGRDSAVQTLTAHFGPDGPLNLSSPYQPSGFPRAVAEARRTPIDDPRYAAKLRAATRAGLDTKALVFTYSSPNLFAKSSQISALPKNPAHLNWTGVTIGGN